MEYVKIPLSAIPNQRFSVVLNDQNCVIHLRQIAETIYCDLTVDDNPVFTGRSCQSFVPINLYPSPYFSGKLIFVDNLGTENPQYEGLGDRWELLYGYDSE